MRGDLKDILARLRALPHPSKASILASLDGELEAGRRSQVENHLQGCSFCREQMVDLQEGLRHFDEASHSLELRFSVSEGLKNLLSSIHDHAGLSDTRSALQQKTSPVYSQLSSELSIYLGSRAATRLLDRCRDSLSEREGLNKAVAPVVVAFLGPHTGAAVLENVMQIWDQSHEVAS